MYIITPRDHMSHDLSYFSGPNTSGAAMSKYTQREKNTFDDIGSRYVILYSRYTTPLFPLKDARTDCEHTDLHNTVCSTASVRGYEVMFL